MQGLDGDGEEVEAVREPSGDGALLLPVVEGRDGFKGKGPVPDTAAKGVPQGLEFAVVLGG